MDVIGPWDPQPGTMLLALNPTIVSVLLYAWLMYASAAFASTDTSVKQMPKMNNGPDIIVGSRVHFTGREFINQGVLGKGMYCTVLRVVEVKSDLEYALKVANDLGRTVDLHREFTLQSEAHGASPRYVIGPLGYDPAAVFDAVEGHEVPVPFQAILLPLVPSSLMQFMHTSEV